MRLYSEYDGGDKISAITVDIVFILRVERQSGKLGDVINTIWDGYYWSMTE